MLINLSPNNGQQTITVGAADVFDHAIPSGHRLLRTVCILSITAAYLILCILYHIIFILSRGNFLHLHRFCSSIVATLGVRICPMGAFPLDIMYYNISISICQVLFLEILLTPIMCTNFTISFWMQPIIFITVMLINQINKQAIYKCNQRCDSKYCPKDNLNYRRLHLTRLLYFVDWIISHQIQFVNT